MGKKPRNQTATRVLYHPAPGSTATSLNPQEGSFDRFEKATKKLFQLPKDDVKKVKEGRKKS